MTHTDFARRIRRLSLEMVSRAKASHIGSCLSTADILAVLYNGLMNIDPAEPQKAGRDRFILSKGHATAGIYAALALRGFFPVSDLDGYSQDGSLLTGHISHHVAGVEVSTGSLGHGLSIGCGMAMGEARRGSPACVFVLMSDGEMDEGSTWEAFLFGGHHRLNNLVAIVDYNKIQSFGRTADVLDLEPLTAKLAAFRWHVQEVDGHSCDAIEAAIRRGIEADGPSVIVAHTVKGKGVSYMENDNLWHYRPPDADLLRQALDEIGPAGSD